MVKTASQTLRTTTVGTAGARSQKQPSPSASLSTDGDEMIALMLADIDGRLDAIEQRTDRLVAQAA